MHYDSDHSSSSSRPKLVWRAERLRTDRIELALAPKRQYDAFTSGAARRSSPARRSSSLAVGGKLGDFNDFLHQHVRSPPARRGARQFVLAGRDARYAALIDVEVERLLLDCSA